MSGRFVDVRIVPHGQDWAVKLTGGRSSKPVKITSSKEEARRWGLVTAANHEVPLLTFDENGNLTQQEPWSKAFKKRKP